jgi:DNA-binding FadR family transcriptional regulator
VAQIDDEIVERRRFRPIKRLQLVDEVLEQLKSRIVSGEFEVGDKLPAETVLIEELGVGRTTLREAIRVLEHAGLLSVRHGSGTYVRSKDDEGLLTSRLRQARVLEVLEVRRALELEMIRMAAGHRSDSVVAGLRQALGRMQRSFKQQDERGFLEADIDVYRNLAAATRNSIFVEVYESFSDAVRLALTHVIAIPGTMQTCLATHRSLVDAISAHDPDGAVAIAREHLDGVTEMIRTILGDTRIDKVDAGREPRGAAISDVRP